VPQPRRCEGRFEVGFGARVEYMKPHAECIGYGRSAHALFARASNSFH
jgi:hypothetical protein